MWCVTNQDCTTSKTSTSNFEEKVLISSDRGPSNLSTNQKRKGHKDSIIEEASEALLRLSSVTRLIREYFTTLRSHLDQ